MRISLAEPVVEPAGHVSGHHHVVGRVQGGVGPHPVVDVEAGVGPTSRVVGATPIPTTTTSAGMTEPSIRATPLTRSPDGASSVTSFGHPDPEPNVDTVVGVQGGTDRAHPVTEDAGQRHGQGLDHGDPERRGPGRWRPPRTR